MNDAATWPDHNSTQLSAAIQDIRQRLERYCELIGRITLGFEFKRQFLAAGAHDAAARKHVHHVGHDVVEQPLIMGDDHE